MKIVIESPEKLTDREELLTCGIEKVDGLLCKLSFRLLSYYICILSLNMQHQMNFLIIKFPRMGGKKVPRGGSRPPLNETLNMMLIQCVPIELLSTFNLPEPSVMLIQRVPVELLSTFNLPEPSVMLIQCVPIELLSTFNLPEPSVMLIQCVPIELLSTFNLPEPSVMLIQCVSP